VNGQISFFQLIRPALIAFIFTSLFQVVLSRILTNPDQAGFVTTFFAMTMIFYGAILDIFTSILGPLSNLPSLLILIALLSLFLLLCTRRVWRIIPLPEVLTNYLNIVFVILFSFQIISTFNMTKNFIFGKKTETKFSSPVSLNMSGETRPDIYIVVLDGYARADVLKDIYHYDNSKFLLALEQRGFYIESQSRGNYVQTQLAISSLLNMDYIKSPSPTDEIYSYYHSAIAANPVFAALKQLGYKTVSFDSGFPLTDIPEADVYQTTFLPLNEFESFLLVGTPAETLSNIFGLKIPTYSYITHRERILYTLKTLPIVSKLSGPKIVFAHILSPHPPFVFDRYGNSIEPDQPYRLGDASDFISQKNSYLNGYRDQLTFISDQILIAIDGILANSKTPPVIILMGDHGPGSMFKWDMQNPGCIWERTGNLGALLLPNHINDPRLDPAMSPVNNIRLVFNLYFDTDLPLLDNKTFLTSQVDPYSMKDNTQESQTAQACQAQTISAPQP